MSQYNDVSMYNIYLIKGNTNTSFDSVNEWDIISKFLLHKDLSDDNLQLLISNITQQSYPQTFCYYVLSRQIDSNYTQNDMKYVHIPLNVSSIFNAAKVYYNDDNNIETIERNIDTPINCKQFYLVMTKIESTVTSAPITKQWGDIIIDILNELRLTTIGVEVINHIRRVRNKRVFSALKWKKHIRALRLSTTLVNQDPKNQNYFLKYMRLFILYYENNEKIPKFPINRSQTTNIQVQIPFNRSGLQRLYTAIYTKKPRGFPRLLFNEPSDTNIPEILKLHNNTNPRLDQSGISE